MMQWYRDSALSSNLILQSVILPIFIGQLSGVNLLNGFYNFSSTFGPSMNFKVSLDEFEQSIKTIMCESPKLII